MHGVGMHCVFCSLGSYPKASRRMSTMPVTMSRPVLWPTPQRMPRNAAAHLLLTESVIRALMWSGPVSAWIAPISAPAPSECMCPTNDPAGTDGPLAATCGSESTWPAAMAWLWDVSTLAP